MIKQNNKPTALVEFETFARKLQLIEEAVASIELGRDRLIRFAVDDPDELEKLSALVSNLQPEINRVAKALNVMKKRNESTVEELASFRYSRSTIATYGLRPNRS